MQFDELIKESIRIYLNFQGLDCLVNPSIPILFFGDSQKYFTSGLKVVTVGLNPSSMEFPDDGFLRFREVGSVYHEILEGKHFDKYLSALNNYFKREPYSWFEKSFEHILHGMGASYYDFCENIALHTDLCSPLATKKTWTDLAHENKDLADKLLGDGIGLWHNLIRFLNPDVIVVSVRKDYFNRIENVSEKKPLFEIRKKVDGAPRKKPYCVEMWNIKIAEGKISRLILGKTVNIPFGSVSTKDKELIGREIQRIMLEETN